MTSIQYTHKYALTRLMTWEDQEFSASAAGVTLQEAETMFRQFLAHWFMGTSPVPLTGVMIKAMLADLRAPVVKIEEPEQNTTED